MNKNQKPNVISIASLIAPPLDVYSLLIDGKIVHIYDANLILLLSQIFGVPYKVSIPSDGEFGVKLANGSWSGVIGMVIRSEADLATDVPLDEENWDAVNFSYPYLFTDNTFMTDKPKPASMNMAIFYPFSLKLWILIATVFFFFSFLLFLQVKKKQTYLIVLFILFGNLMEKSIDIKLRKKMYRLILSTWLIFAFIITNCYKALLLSFLTLPSMTGIRTISDLGKAAEENSVTCYTYKGTPLPQILIESHFDSWNSIGRCLQRQEMALQDAEEAFVKLPPGKAFLGPRIYLEPYQKDYLISAESFFNIMFVFPISRNFCCKNYLNEMIHRLFAAGIFQKLCIDEQVQLELKLGSSRINASNDSKILQIGDLKGAFIILISGYVLSIITLLIEITAKRYLRRCNIARFKH